MEGGSRAPRKKRYERMTRIERERAGDRAQDSIRQLRGSYLKNRCAGDECDADDITG